MRVHCHILCTDMETFDTWLKSMISIGLLMVQDDEETVYSNRALFNINEYRIKRDKASSAAKSRWSNANAEQTQSERNAKKRKEKKRNSSNATKSITTTSSDAAATAEAAPPADDNSRAPHCPMCDGLLKMDVKAGGWSCECIGAVKPESVVWR